MVTNHESTLQGSGTLEGEATHRRETEGLVTLITESTAHGVTVRFSIESSWLHPEAVEGLRRRLQFKISRELHHLATFAEAYRVKTQLSTKP